MGTLDDGIINHVVSRAALENILDFTPCYAIGSLENKFDLVLQLFAKGPQLNDHGGDNAGCEGIAEGRRPQNRGEGDEYDENGEDAMDVYHHQ